MEIRYSSDELRVKDAGTCSYEMHKKNRTYQCQGHLQDRNYDMTLQFTKAMEI